MERPSAVVIKRRFLVPPFELWIAIVALYAGLTHFVPVLAANGQARAVELKFPELAGIWSALYGAGGVGMIAGLVTRRRNLEGFGLCLLGGGVFVALVATFASGAAVVPTVIGLGGIIAACAHRFCALRKRMA